MADLQLNTESDLQLVEVKLNEATSELTRAENDLIAVQRSWLRLAAGGWKTVSRRPYISGFVAAF